MIALNRMDALFTVLCNGERKNTVWYDCPVSPEQLICLFRARLRWDGHNEEVAPIPAIVVIYSAIRGCYASIREVVFNEAENNAGFKQGENRAILKAHAIKRKTVSAKPSWDKTIQQTGAA